MNQAPVRLLACSAAVDDGLAAGACFDWNVVRQAVIADGLCRGPVGKNEERAGEGGDESAGSVGLLGGQRAPGAGPFGAADAEDV